MRRLINPLGLLRLLSVVLAALFAASGAAWGAPGDVVTSWETPCRYPAGMAADDKALYLLDWRAARLYRISPEGQVLNDWPAPTLHPHGLARQADRLFISDDRTGRIFVFEPATGLVVNAFDAPGRGVSGLAYGNDVLYILERRSRKVYRVLPEDGTILGSFPLPDPRCTCMTFDGRYLWIANRLRDELYMVTPDDGTVIGILDAPGPHAAGLAWLDGHLWNADFQNRRVYRLVVEDDPPYRVRNVRRVRCEYAWDLSNYGPGTLRDVYVNIAVPQDLPNQKLLSEVTFSPAPVEWVTDRWGQRCARFAWDSLPPGEKLSAGFRVDVELASVRYLIRPERCGTLADIPEEIRRAYTVDGSRYRIDSPFIRETARKIVGDEQNPYWIARRIYSYLHRELHYEMVGGWDVPEAVLKRGSGSCSEYTFAFVALCRAAGLPARYQGSVTVRGDDASVDDAFHRWAQVYLPNYGWVPVDPSGGDESLPADQGHGFGELDNRFLITTQGGGDSEYLHWTYNSYAHYAADGHVHVEEDNLGFWEPLEPEDASGKNRSKFPVPAPAKTCVPRP